jgi:hypothetical protein
MHCWPSVRSAALSTHRRYRGRPEADSAAALHRRLPPLHPRRRTIPAVLGVHGAGTHRQALAPRRSRRPSRAVAASVAE